VGTGLTGVNSGNGDVKINESGNDMAQGFVNLKPLLILSEIVRIQTIPDPKIPKLTLGFNIDPGLHSHLFYDLYLFYDLFLPSDLFL
jgi:hypothetical protein